MQNEVKALPGQACPASRFGMTKTWLASLTLIMLKGI
jgi:hypothetical protein